MVQGEVIDIDRILLELELLPEFDKQISLQGVKGQTDPFYGIGRSTELNHAEEDFIHPLFDMPYLYSILEEHEMFRSRVMKMKPGTCYSYHQDPTKRKHIPLVTNDKCFFVVEDKVVRFPIEYKVKILDTTKMHTAVNASLEDRIHIVGCIK